MKFAVRQQPSWFGASWYVQLLLLLIVMLATERVSVAQPDSPKPTARLQLDGREAYAGMPFTLALVVEGLDEDPAPAQPALALSGAKITPLGAEPNVSQSMRMVGGQVYNSRSVTWVLRWSVEIASAQTIDIPSLTVEQGGKKVSARGAKLEVKALPSTDDMKLSLALPNRAIWVGEPVAVQLDWLVRRSPGDPVFSVPLLGLDDDFSITVPPVTDPRQAITFTAGSRDIELPFVRSDVDDQGTPATLFRFTFTITPRRAGSLEVPASSVVAGLAVGRRDIFGNASQRLFRVIDQPRKLEVRALPQAGRPASFAGAVGTGFGLSVRASRSVVSLGEPVELELTVRGESGLDVLSLPRLDGDGGLPKSSFTVPSDSPIGELAADGKSKTFRVSAQVIGPATEIPKLALSYFDPVAATYRTVYSEPIALSIKGGTTVGAADVVASNTSAAAVAQANAGLPATGNDLHLALSSPSSTLDGPRSGTWLWILVALLYAVPLGLFGFRAWQTRSADRRDEQSELKQSHRALLATLAKARTGPARDSAGPVVQALRHVARASGQEKSEAIAALTARVETAGYAPSSATEPLSAALCDDLAACAKKLAATPKRRASVGTTASLLVLAAVSSWANTAHADPLSDGRAAYQNALAANSDPVARQRYYLEAATAFEAAARATPDRPELLTDWGNAALGAGDLGTATLAYRRALAIDAGSSRAQKNLAFLRGRLPANLRPAEASAADTLLFFNSWPRSLRILVGAGAFAVAILLMIPWSNRRRRGLRVVALIPLAAWLALTASVLFEADHADDAVAIESVVLRTADSVGAPAALAVPLPAGTEVAIVEGRDGWLRVRIAAGTTGWIPQPAARRVIGK